MTKKSMAFAILSALLFTAIVTTLPAQDTHRVAVLDFSMHSTKAEYQYLGKGFTEFIAIEIASNPRVRLVDRKIRNAVLEEQDFSLTGLTDVDEPLKLGKLLTARYLVSGDIFDMVGRLVITWALLDAETGEVIGTGRIDGTPQEYSRLTREISGGIIASLGLAKDRVRPATVPVLQLSEAKAEEVLTGFSAVVDAYDRNDIAEASKQISRIRKIDSTSSAIRFYSDLLAIYTSRFKIVAAPYFPLENPAALPRLSSDMAYLQLNQALVGPIGGRVWEPSDKKHYPLSDAYGDYKFGVVEMDGRLTLGYRTPLGTSYGWGSELFTSFMLSEYQNYGETSQSYIYPTYIGGIGSFGTALSQGVSLGVSGTGVYSFETLTYLNETQTKHEEFNQLFFAFAIGVLVKNSTGSLVYSAYGGWSNQTWYVADLENYFDPDVEGGTWDGKEQDYNRPLEENAPYYLEQTLSLGIRGNSTFFILKYLSDFWCSGGPQPYMQLIGTVEHRFSDRLSFRVGGGYAFSLSETMQGSPGGNLGLTWSFGNGWDSDVSSALRSRPSKVTPDEIVPEISINMGVSKSGIFRDRR